MSVAFVKLLMDEGRLHVDEDRDWAADAAALDFLKRWGEQQALHVPGPRLIIDATLAAQAVQTLYRAAWCFLHPDAEVGDQDFSTWLARTPRSPDEHFSADLALRFLAGLWQRAQNRDVGPLVHKMKEILRRWPLSGVLANISEPPEAPAELGGHPGLAFLYAERLSRQPHPAAKAGWMPSASSLPFMELVWQHKKLEWPQAAATGDSGGK